MWKSPPFFLCEAALQLDGMGRQCAHSQRHDAGMESRNGMGGRETEVPCSDTVGEAFQLEISTRGKKGDVRVTHNKYNLNHP